MTSDLTQINPAQPVSRRGWLLFTWTLAQPWGGLLRARSGAVTPCWSPAMTPTLTLTLTPGPADRGHALMRTQTDHSPCTRSRHLHPLSAKTCDSECELCPPAHPPFCPGFPFLSFSFLTLFFPCRGSPPPDVGLEALDRLLPSTLFCHGSKSASLHGLA